ncbi:hypothetical protein FOL47_006889 [Perkinsus chesapeaki]|uniref:Uncharacterized protein n=1 Tax=Perkinsus chesapeaki TaxID=330153 RepID=A0A7J6LP46_PERCH|nr:hypothetical protein FOL47_006889 [Perkinsus chesapeaki]
MGYSIGVFSLFGASSMDSMGFNSPSIAFALVAGLNTFVFLVETHEGSIGRSSTVESTIASSSDVDANEEDIIASLYTVPPAGDKTSRRSSKCQLGLPQGFMGIGIDSEASELEMSPSRSPTKGKAVRFGVSSPRTVMVKNDSSGELTRRTTNRLRRFRSSSVVTAVHVYDDVEYGSEDMWWRLSDGDGGADGFNEDMFLSPGEEEEDTSEVDSDQESEEIDERAPQAPKPVQLRRAQSAPASALFPNSPMASTRGGDVFAALVSPIHRSTPCDPSSPCRTITCGLDNTVPCGRRHSVGEVIRNRTDKEMHNPFLMADLQARRSSYWRRRHVPCPVHS